MPSSKNLIFATLLLLTITGGYLWYERQKVLEPKMKDEARTRVIQELEREWERLSLPPTFRIVRQTPPAVYEELSHTPFCYMAVAYTAISTVYDKTEAVREFMDALPAGEWKGDSSGSGDVWYLYTRYKASSGHGILQIKQLSDAEIRGSKIKTDDDYPNILAVSLDYHPPCSNIAFRD